MFPHFSSQHLYETSLVHPFELSDLALHRQLECCSKEEVQSQQLREAVKQRWEVCHLFLR